MKVHILATCRKKELLPYTLLVFNTIRIGFPTAHIFAYFNQSEGCGVYPEMSMACTKSGVLEVVVNTNHHQWIESLINREKEPFWIVDTDVIFYGNVEAWEFFDYPKALVGLRVPEWKDECSGAITRARLHTSLMRIDPVQLKSAQHDYENTIPDTYFLPRANLIYPLVIPFKRGKYFYDTMSLMYHAIGGTAFPDFYKEDYFHFHSGTISDMVIPRLRGADKMLAEREAIMKDPQRGRGKWREHEQFWAERQV